MNKKRKTQNYRKMVDEYRNSNHKYAEKLHELQIEKDEHRQNGLRFY